MGRSDAGYRSLSDVTDVCGVRVITYFARDVDAVAAVVADEFDVDVGNSIDKRETLDPDRFGYVSLHYVVSLGASRTALPEFRRYAGLKAEIQIRSILQHAWAEIEHDLGYKTAAGIPKSVRRQFSRLAGLLEIADGEFGSIREALADYERGLDAAIASDPGEVLIDKASLTAFIGSNALSRALDTKLGKFAGGGVSATPPEHFERLAAAFDVLGVNTIGAIEALLRAREHVVVEVARRKLEGRGFEGVGEGVTLMYLVLALACQTGSLSAVADVCNILQIVLGADEVLASYSEVLPSA